MTLDDLKAAAEKAGMAKFYIAGQTRDDMYVIGRDFLDRLYLELQKPAPQDGVPS